MLTISVVLPPATTAATAPALASVAPNKKFLRAVGLMVGADVGMLDSGFIAVLLGVVERLIIDDVHLRIGRKLLHFKRLNFDHEKRFGERGHALIVI